MHHPKIYREDTGLSQSDINLFEKNLYEFYRQKILNIYPEETQKKHFDVGDLVDIRYCQPKLITNYNYSIAAPAPGIETICKALSEIAFRSEDTQPLSTDIEAYANHYEAVIKGTEYRYNKVTNKFSWKLETISDEIKKEGKLYFANLIENKGKRLVSYDNWQLSIECYDKIINSDNSEIQQLNEYLAIYHKKGELPKGIEIFTAKDLYASSKGIRLKGLLDIVLVDHNKKTVTIYDLKTTENHDHFVSSYKSLLYIRQGAFYYMLASANFPGYTINPFRFIVCPKNSDEKVELYEMCKEDISAALVGSSYGYPLKGCVELVAEIQWHKENNLWQHRKSYYDSNGLNILALYKPSKNNLQVKKDMF